MHIAPDQIEPILISLADRLAEKIANPFTHIESMTFGELFALYYERHVKVRLRDTTNRNAYYFFKVHGPRWQAVHVHAITRRDVQEWADGLAVQSKSSATRAVNMMSAIINWGIRRDLLPPIKNPCIGVEKFDVASRKRFLSPAEFARLKDSLEQEAPMMRDFFWVCLLTGARRGNVLAMRWDEIDFDLASWTIPDAKFKTGSGHIVPLTSWALTVLHRRHEMNQGSPWVFPGRRADSHLQEPKRAWSRILERAGISNLRIHDLRRTLASYMAIKGENQYVIAQMLGHKDMRSTAIYARLNLQAVRGAAESVNGGWQGMLALPAVCAPLKRLEACSPVNSVRTTKPKNADIKIAGAEQVIVEARILTALRAGGSIKKHFYQRFGRIQVNSSELERILAEMIDRKLIGGHQNDSGQRQYRMH